MAKTSSVNKRNSRLVQGGTTTTFPLRLGWWSRLVMVQDDDDLFLTVTNRQDRRPDIIAADVYGQANLAWVVLQFNNIADINLELQAGTEIRLPTQDRLFFDMLNRPTGGVPNNARL
jgi:hypothetical protein